MSTRPTFAVALIVVGSLAACHKKQPADRLSRSGEPDFVYSLKEDREMDAAMRRAQETLPAFAKALEAPPPGVSRFAIKKAYSDGEKTEFIWLSDVTLAESGFRATVDNVPAWLKTPKLGDDVIVKKGEVVDWMYVDNGNLVGGFTMRVLLRRETPAKQREIEAAAGFKIPPE